MSNLGAMGVLFTPDMQKVFLAQGENGILSPPYGRVDNSYDGMTGTIETVKRAIYNTFGYSIESEPSGFWLDKKGIQYTHPIIAFIEQKKGQTRRDVFFYQLGANMPKGGFYGGVRTSFSRDQIVTKTPGDSIMWSAQVHAAVLKLLK